MPQEKKKGRGESFARTASFASASLQRGEGFPMASTGRSVKDAVPGREDGKDAVTQDELQPPKANGGMQILDRWSLTLTSPSSTTSISPSTTSIEVRENAVKSSLAVVGNGAKVDQHSAPSFAWQDDVKDAVVNAW